jgi:hypothetical protein
MHGTENLNLKYINLFFNFLEKEYSKGLIHKPKKGLKSWKQ